MVRCRASASARLTAADPLTALLPAPCPPRRLLPMLLAGRRRRSAVVGLAELAQVGVEPLLPELQERERLPVEALPSQIRPCPATSRLTSAALREPAVLALARPPLEALSPRARLPAAAECGRVGLPFTATATVFGFRSTSAPADSGRACRSSAIDAE